MTYLNKYYFSLKKRTLHFKMIKHYSKFYQNKLLRLSSITEQKSYNRMEKVKNNKEQFPVELLQEILQQIRSKFNTVHKL